MMTRIDKQTKTVKKVEESTNVEYFHQAGGHSRLWLLNDFIVCKPQTENEEFFYKNTPSLLEKYVPKYFGIVQPVPTRLPTPRGYFGQLIIDEQSSDSQVFSNHDSQGKEPTEDILDDSVFGDASTRNNLIYANEVDEIRNRCKPLLCENDAQRFIMLENLTKPFENPSILDIKLGIRQHTYNSTASARCRQIKKVQNTMSKDWGVRLNGMKVYDAKTGSWQVVDKIDGRSLTIDTFKTALELFFSVIPSEDNKQRSIVDQVLLFMDGLKASIQSLDCWRFWGSSLLFICGRSCTGSGGYIIACRLVDFAKTFNFTNRDWPHRINNKNDAVMFHGIGRPRQSDTGITGPDEGLLKGLDTMDCVLKSMFKNNSPTID